MLPVRIQVAPGLGPGHALLLTEGDLDLAGAQALSDAIDEQRATHDAVTIDMAECSFIDSAALRVLLVAHRATRLAIRNPSDAVARLFELTGVGGYLNVYTS